MHSGIACTLDLGHNTNQMNIIKIKTALPFAAAVILLSFACSLIFARGAAAQSGTPTSAQIAATIQAKCGSSPPALSQHMKEKHGKEEAYKTLSDACFGSGVYKEGHTHKAQRAKRLYDICYNYEQYLREDASYKSKGSIDGGDCDKIVKNTELLALTSNLKDYPKGTLGHNKDPALECGVDKDKCDLMKKYVNPVINLLSILVGLAVTIGLISAGLSYSAAGDDSQKVSIAKNRIRSAIIALLAFLFLYAAIQWMLPKGVLD
jgi:hypothetical protein